MRRKVGHALRAFHFDLLARVLLKVEKLLGFPARRNRRMVAQYLSQNKVRKLHIGCGSNTLSGWLNSDFNPAAVGVMHLDASQIFPISDNEFAYVFSEHMIEHISYAQGLQMLTECFRVMSDKGTIRISTPDLSFLIDLYKEQKSDQQKEYIEWFINRYIPGIDDHDETFVINNFVRNWGHTFIYDEKTLRSSMEKAGFIDVTKRALSESEDDALRNLENVQRLPEGLLRLETMTLEGRKITTS